MSILADEHRRGHLERVSLVYLILSLLCALFGAVYERFSHEVYSGYLIYAFLIPLAGGAFPFLWMAISRLRRLPGELAMTLYHSGLATLTVGSIFEGVLEIYGTTNALTAGYWVVGAAFTGAGLLLYLLARSLPQDQQDGEKSLSTGK